MPQPPRKDRQPDFRPTFTPQRKAEPAPGEAPGSLRLLDRLQKLEAAVEMLEAEAEAEKQAKEAETAQPPATEGAG